MKASKEGIDLIKSCESLRLTAYQDSVGVWTIGWGHTLRVQPGQIITQGMAEVFLDEDLEEVFACIERKVTGPLNQFQFDALCSFIFNLGCGKFEASTLRRLINEGNYAGAAEQFKRWNHAGGEVLEGLTKRREAEATLFCREDPDATNPNMEVANG